MHGEPVKASRLLLRFWQLERPSELLKLARLQEASRASLDVQAAILQCLKRPLTKKYPPGTAYLRKLLKEVLLLAESEQAEVSEEIAELYTESLLKPLELEGTITLRLSQNMFEGSTGCHEWEAGFFLAEYILNHPDLVRGKRVMELGCGSGLLGVVLHRLGAASVALTDGDHKTLCNCLHNLHINRAEGPAIAARHMQWEGMSAEPCDLLFGSDILYDPEPFPVLVPLINRIVNSGAEAYICTTVRQEATFEQFLRLVSDQSGLIAELVARSPSREWPVQFLECLPLCDPTQQIVLHKISAGA